MRVHVPLAIAVVLAAPAAARVVSYAPVTDRIAAPVQQPRTSAQFVLIESEADSLDAAEAEGSPWLRFGATFGRLVIYDATGQAEARVVLPTAGPDAWFVKVAARPGSDGALRILALTDTDPSGNGARGTDRLLFSRDGGDHWKEVPLPAGALAQTPYAWVSADTGGPVVRGRDHGLRLGSDSSPFVLMLYSSSPAQDERALLVAVDDDGTARTLAKVAGESGWSVDYTWLAGSDRSGAAILAYGRLKAPSDAGPGIPAQALWRVRTAGGVEKLIDLNVAPGSDIDGWLTSTGAAYFTGAYIGIGYPNPEAWKGPGLFLVEGGVAKEVAVDSGDPYGSGVLAIPSSDFDGAWVVTQGERRPTTLASHSRARGLAQMWSDPTAPRVMALHAGSSGWRLLIEAYRPTGSNLLPYSYSWYPALAVWSISQRAPQSYDELYLNGQSLGGFVHLDVDEVARGAPFVFDSGRDPWEGYDPWGYLKDQSGDDAGSGGADVVQEWGVVRASLRQRLVIPAVARSEGAGGAFWKSDLLLRNPGSESQRIDLRFVPRGGGDAREAVITLMPREIRIATDVLGTFFGVSSGSGALFVTPEGTRGVSATSRTWTAAQAGTYGMSMGAVDLITASSARFRLSSSGALPGEGYRTNAGGVDVGGRGAGVGLRLASESGWTGRADFSFHVAPGGSAQVDRISSTLEVEPWRTGALEYAPVSGAVVPFVTTIDEKTNDPTYWSPDLPGSAVRVIPALVHADGSNGARFRSDLFLFNDTDRPASVTLAAKRWDSTEAESNVKLTLLPREARVVRDALAAMFDRTGVARLRIISNVTGPGTGVRVTSRAYTELPGGGTYGVPLPPLNAFQMAGPGNSLELFGVLGGPSFRSNLSLVEMSPPYSSELVRARVELIGDGGATLDAFDVYVKQAGGIQIDDLFRTRGLGDGPAAALVRVTPAGGLIGAYATSIDQGTNDAILVPAALAAHD